MKDTYAVVLAAGKGTRMGSDRPKVLHELAGKPMLFYTLEKLNNAGIGKIIVVIGYKGNEVREAIDNGISFSNNIEYREQPEQKGTGDAVRCGIRDLKGAKNILVVNGDDSAFYNEDTVKKVLDNHKESDAAITFVSIVKQDPTGFGRIIRAGGKVKNIVEEKDVNMGQRQIKEVNAGFYVFNFSWLKENIEKIKLSKTGEYYIVDLVKIAVENGDKVKVYKLENESEWYGVNTKDQLMTADRIMREKVSSLID